jgi:phosphoadenosine phosphosulfate reductase
MGNTISSAELKRLNSAFETAEPTDILRWTFRTFGEKATLACGFGYPGMALLDMTATINPRVRVFTIDTEKLFPETYDLKKLCKRRYGITIKAFRPLPENLEWLAKQHGENPNYKKAKRILLDTCCHVRKVEPLERAIEGFDAWITSIQRSQTGRDRISILSTEPNRGGILKVCPFANWTEERIWEYIYDHNVPYNPLHKMGYPSIGCVPCTKKVEQGRDSRAGRWAGHEKTECGIHQELVRLEVRPSATG